MTRTAAITASAAALLALAACTPAPAPQGSTTPSCTPDFGPGGTGINAFAGTVTASVTLDCTGPYDAPDPLISLALVRQPPGSATAAAAGGAAYQHPELTYTATGACAPGDWALHILYGVVVDHHDLAGQTWGKQVHLTAADCG